MQILTIAQSIVRPSDTTQYAAGDVIGGAALPFHGFPPLKGAQIGAVLQHGVMVSNANQATKLDAELWLFSASPTIAADNVAFAPTDAQMLDFIGIITFPVANWKVSNAGAAALGNAACTTPSIGIAVPERVFGVLVARNTYTPVADEAFNVSLTAVRGYLE